MNSKVQATLDQLLTDTPSNIEDFDPISYINEIFPNEQSLSSIDDVILQVESAIENLDTEIQASIRSSENDQKVGEQALEESQVQIEKLVEQIQSIALQAKQSEQTVRELTNNMKQLDLAKRNLSQAIGALTHLDQLVVSTVELEQASENKNYAEASENLKTAMDVINLLQRYTSIPKISSLVDRVNHLKMTLTNQACNDLQKSLVQPRPQSLNIQHLRDACKVLDAALANDVQEKFLTNLINHKLIDQYRLLYEPSQDCSWLDSISSRYDWVTNQITEFENSYSQIFPHNWHVSERLAVAFCEETKSQLNTVMQRRKRELELDLLWSAITETLKYESDLNSKYAGIYVRIMMNKGTHLLKPGAQSSDPGSDKNNRLNIAITTDGNISSDPNNPNSTSKSSQNSNPFNLLIAACFEPYMDVYIKARQQQLHILIEKFRSEVLKVVQLTREPNAEINVLGQLADAEYFNNATELFIFYKKCLVDFCKISTGKQLLNLIEQCFQKYLKNYTDLVLLDAIPGSRGTLFLGVEKNAKKIGKLHNEIYPARPTATDKNNPNNSSPNAGSMPSSKSIMSDLTDNKTTFTQKFTQLKSFVKEKDVIKPILNLNEFIPLNNAEICFICKIIGTADWCISTAHQLEEKLISKVCLKNETRDRAESNDSSKNVESQSLGQKAIEEQNKYQRERIEKLISFESELTNIKKVINLCISSLVDDIYGNCCEKVMILAIPKVNWEAIVTPGDTSPYVRECCNKLSNKVPFIRDNLLSQRVFFTNFLIKFVSQWALG